VKLSHEKEKSVKYLLILLLLVGCTVTEPASPEASVTPAMAQTVFCITPSTAQSVNIRELPEINARVTGTLTDGTVATVVRTEGQWYEITINTALVGYVASWVVHEVPCFGSGSSDPMIQIECFEQVMESPAVFVKGGYAWSNYILNNEKVAKLYQVILSEYAGTPHDRLYIQFTDSQDELLRIFPENDSAQGAYGPAILIDDCMLEPIDGVSPQVPVIVAWSSSLRDFYSDVQTLIHELSHAAGAKHGGWQDNAYFWGVIGKKAASSQCFVFDDNSEEARICNKMQEIIVS